MTDMSLADGPIRDLRVALPDCSAKRALSPAALTAISELCQIARNERWLPETLLIVVKNAFYSSREVAHDLTPSERDSLLSTVVSACIAQYYANGNGDGAAPDGPMGDADGINKAT
ncbi:MAG: hypothetical protein ABIS03_13475 [Gemmatimonadaceae bacterium]